MVTEADGLTPWPRAGGEFPTFVPHPYLRHQHAQTVAAMYLPAAVPQIRSIAHEIELPDRDKLILHEDLPESGPLNRRAMLLIHGLGGSHQSPYVRRVASKLTRCGIRSFRMDMRGWGQGFRLSREWSHAGRSEDILASLHWIRQKYPNCELLACGFSLGANMLLKLLTESTQEAPAGLEAAMAVAPPIDLATCVQRLNRGMLKAYDLFFSRKLWSAYRKRIEQPHVRRIPLARKPRSLLEFDTLLTAPLGGFSSVHDYYSRCSSGMQLNRIQLPTWILTSIDDPLIPHSLFRDMKLSSSTRINMTSHGGHLGFVSRHAESCPDAFEKPLPRDHRWLDWRVLDFARSSHERKHSS
jgi:uncharacterized protein